MQFPSWLKYQSVRVMTVRDPTLVCAYYSIILLVVCYIVGYMVVLKKGYQTFDQVVGSTMIKVKGVATLNSTQRIVFDADDLVVPPLQPDAVFITTNFQESPNQIRSVCPGRDSCNCSHGDVSVCCKRADKTSNGENTGVCSNEGYCEVSAWCPVEKQNVEDQILEEVRTWTVYIRTNVNFPKFKAKLTNAPTGVPEFGVSLFTVEQMINATGWSFDDVKQHGAMVLATFRYDCDMDYWLHEHSSTCLPTIAFERLDVVEGNQTLGFNFRDIKRWRSSEGVEFRDLKKMFGVYVIVRLYGEAGRFNLAGLSVTVGSGLAFLSVATLIADFTMQYLLPVQVSARYVGKKFKMVTSQGECDDVDDDGAAVFVNQDNSAPTETTRLLDRKPGKSNKKQ